MPQDTALSIKQLIIVFGGRFATGEMPRPTTSASEADEGDGGDGGAESMSFDLF